jgi:hypothetical protein
MNHRTDTRPSVTMSTVLFALADEMRADMPTMPDLSAIEDADALHETACDVYDIATRELDAARDALTEAARRLTDAEDEWSRAGAEMNDAARRVSQLRLAAGVIRTADGYRSAVTS